MGQPLRRRIRNHPWVVGSVARVVTAWLKLCDRTIRWDIEGADQLAAMMADGPVVLVMWHEHLLMAMPHWQRHGGPMAGLHDTSPIGRIAGHALTHFGHRGVPISSNTSNLARARATLQAQRDGVSLGITADGPSGPRRELKDAPLAWVEKTKAPVVIYSFACTRCWRLKTWDRMILPRLFGRGVYQFTVWEADGDEDLQTALIAASDEVEARLR